MSNNLDFLPCHKRQKMVEFNQDGTQTGVFRCTEPDAVKGYQNVTPSDCQKCDLRRELLRKENQRAPSALVREGVKTRTSPGFPACQDRLVVTKTCCGGSVRQMWVCDSMESPFYHGEIGPPDCTQCPARRE